MQVPNATTAGVSLRGPPPLPSTTLRHSCCLLARSDHGCWGGCDSSCDSSCNSCPSCNSLYEDIWTQESRTGPRPHYVGLHLRCYKNGRTDDARWNWCTPCVQPCGSDQYLSRRCSHRSWKDKTNTYLLGQRWESDAGRCSTCSNIKCSDGKRRVGSCTRRAAGCNCAAAWPCPELPRSGALAFPLVTQMKHPESVISLE